MSRCISHILHVTHMHACDKIDFYSKDNGFFS